MNSKRNPADTNQMSNEELKQFLAKEQAAKRNGSILMTVGIILTFVLSMVNVVGTIVAAIIMVVGIYIRQRAAANIKTTVANNIARGTLNEVFENVTYNPTSHISESVIRGNPMGMPDFDEMKGSDFVRATYKGLQIEMSDIQLISVSVSYDEDGGRHENRTTVFNGLWLTCDFSKELSADLWLSERGKLGKHFAIGGCKTESEAFNKQFYIESKDEHEVFYVLTPHMMEYILEMDRKGGGETHLRFTRGGKMHLAIRSNRDSFEIHGNVKDLGLIHDQFLSEIHYVTDLIDELKLVDTLYRDSTDTENAHEA